MASLLLGTTSMATHSISFSFSHSHSIAGFSLSSPSTVSLSTSVSTSPPLPLIYCGRGDKKTAKGKRFNHSFGNARPKNKNKGRGPPKAPIVPKGDPSEKEE
ncbi:30S ribosomal protein S31, chloroplastic-like [Chenopodium quinoa]|uniref:30S ribosomal protein S31, chloroplastic-like n=1 Tax=Chenopodium quinoa TaxID=63459 RepID=UPI000B791D79|nr:30S ribosomal protein S31, chloroplastic-like [Chenopodium quinoa]